MSYVVQTEKAATGTGTATDPAPDSGGTTQTVSLGEYVYTFGTKAPAGVAPTDTNRIGIFGSRNLTEFDLGTNYADTTYDFVPAGGTPAPRDIVKTADCNQCHGLPNGMTSVTGSAGMSHHGGRRRSVSLCIMCHQPQNTDPNTGHSLDFKVMIHKIHDGSSLPSVQAGNRYFIGTGSNPLHDWSTVVFPADVRRCEVCHNPKNGASQTNYWLTMPSMAACGSCHDNVNFTSGQNHPGGPQVDNSLCANCHIPQGELPFDASIKGAHLVPTDTKLTWPLNPDPMVNGVTVAITKVTNTAAGQAPAVAFTVKDVNGNPLAVSDLSALRFTMAGPTPDYGYTSFGSDVTTPGYVQEDASKASNCASTGVCTYTFQHAVPSNATGTYSIGAEAERTEMVLPGTTSAMTVTTGAPNPVVSFAVSGSTVNPPPAVVSTSNCDECHANLQAHGGLRDNTQYCIFCHNPSDTDFSQRPNAVVASERTKPPQGINFPLLIHKVHSGENLETQFGQDYIVVGFRGSQNDFGAAFASVPKSIPNTGVRFPAMGPTGTPHDTAECYMCHLDNTESMLPIGQNPVTDPQGRENPTPPVTSACTACHLNQSAYAHAAAQTNSQFGESCDVCHGVGADFSADKVHAGL